MNSLSFRPIGAALLVGAALVAGCGRRDSSTSSARSDAITRMVPPTEAPPETISRENAVISVVSARCERELRCHHIGTGRKFTTDDECSTDATSKFQSDLKASRCQTGVVKKELEECLAEIRNNDCDDPFDAVGELAACRTSDLCKTL